MNYQQPSLAAPYPESDVWYERLRDISYWCLGLICIPTVIISGIVLISMKWYRCIRRFGFGHILCLNGCAISASIYGIVIIWYIDRNDIQVAWIILQFFRWMIIFVTNSLITFHVVISRACSGLDQRKPFLTRLFPRTSDNFYMVYTVMILSILYTPIPILYSLAPRTYTLSTGISLFLPVILELIFYLLLTSVWFYYAWTNYRYLPSNFRHYANFWQNLSMMILSFGITLARIFTDGLPFIVTEARWAKYQMLSILITALTLHTFVYIWIGQPFFYIIQCRAKIFEHSQKPIVLFDDDSEPAVTSEMVVKTISYFDQAYDESISKTWTTALNEYQSFVNSIRDDCLTYRNHPHFRTLWNELDLSSVRTQEQIDLGNYGTACLFGLEDLLRSGNSSEIIGRFPETSGVLAVIEYIKTH